MRKISFLFQFLLGISLSLLCSCATHRPDRPSDVSMNKGAGRSDVWVVNLHLEGGEDMLFAVDTGAPVTVVDRSLRPKLGKVIEKFEWDEARYGVRSGEVHQMPKLYLGNTQLVGTWAVAVDMKGISDAWREISHSDRPLMGLLGLDCLKNYCIQLDFTMNKVRFLDPDHLETKNLGKPFPLTISHCAQVRETLVGVKGRTTIDSGCNFDGVLTAELYRQWTNTSSAALKGQVRSPDGVFGGQTYKNLLLHGAGGDGNLLGLSFLARNLVTLNFPKRTMYLKPTSVGPIAGDEFRPVAPKF